MREQWIKSRPHNGLDESKNTTLTSCCRLIDCFFSFFLSFSAEFCARIPLDKWFLPLPEGIVLIPYKARSIHSLSLSLSSFTEWRFLFLLRPRKVAFSSNFFSWFCFAGNSPWLSRKSSVLGRIFSDGLDENNINKKKQPSKESENF